MTVNRADIIESKFLEQRAAGPEAARELLGPSGLFLKEFWKVPRELFSDIAQGAVSLAGDEPCQIGRHGTDRRRNRHIVVVENDDQPLIARAGIVHGLVRHAGGHRPVANDGHDIVLLAVQIPRHRHAESGRDRRR